MSRLPSVSAGPWLVLLSTPDGVFTARFTAWGLAALAFPGRAGRPPRGAPRGQAGQVTGEWVRWTEAALASALAGRPAGRLPPLDWQGATPFQMRIWRALLAIPAGSTRTYAALAATAGHPRAARAVGAACGANPIPVLVPCHRVVPSGGGLGGFSGGAPWKQALLRREGVRW